MLDPLDFQNRPLIEKLENKRKLAFLTVLGERLGLYCWRPLTWILFMCSFWLFQIPIIFGLPGEFLAVFIFLVGLGYFLYEDTRHLSWPSAQEIDRRLEKDSHIRHRPIASLKDKLANPTKAKTRALWQENRAHALQTLFQVKPAKPRALLAKIDPHALRLGALLFFGLGIFTAGPNWDVRIWNGLTPLQFEQSPKDKSNVMLWVIPPKYTGLGEVVLNSSGKSSETLQIPRGSILKLSVNGGLGHPQLHIDEQSWPLNHSSNDNYTFEIPVPQGRSIEIKQMIFSRASWYYELLPDAPPVITLKGEAKPLPDGPVQFPLMVYDDYGVQHLTMTMTLDDMLEDPPLGIPIQRTRSIMSPGGTEFEISPIYDLTAHLWAGLPVIFNFTATDHIGQEASISPVSMTLPERSFSHPVAKRLIAMRKKLAWGPLEKHDEIGLELEALLSLPDMFQHDMVVFLALRTAASRIFYSDPSIERSQSLIALLWDTALRIEDGNLTLAARNLRSAQMALENALQDPNVTDQEVMQLMHELRQAMAEFLMELQKELQKQMAEGKTLPLIPPELLNQTLDPEALSNFLDQMESEMLSGDKNAAQNMLSQLQRMLDMLDPSMAMGGLPFDMQMMSEGINELQELIERQEELLEQTQKQISVLDMIKSITKDYGATLPTNKNILKEWGIDNMPPSPEAKQRKLLLPNINTQANKAEQEALRYILGQLMLDAAEALDNIPEKLGLAEREMSGSSENLGDNRPDLSIPHQEKTLEYLKDAQKELSQQLMARMQQTVGMSFRAGGMRYDPLGRPYGEQGDENQRLPGSSVKIPSEQEKKRAQEILRELRRRSSELDRPDEELEYYRRLLRQF